jgi:hypothetical protein
MPSSNRLWFSGLCKATIFILLAANAVFISIRLSTLVHIFYQSSPRITPHGNPPDSVTGRWHQTLLNLGIEPFSGDLQPEALRHSRPEGNLRFDLRKRKRAFSLPSKSDLHFTDPVSHAPVSPAQHRRILERELQAFKKVHDDHTRSENAKERMQKRHR